MKKLIKVLLVLVILFIVLAVVAVLIVGSHLGQIVKAAIETGGPRVTQTTLTVDSVNISLLGGSASLNKFALGNPDGFKSPQCLTFDKAAVSLVPGSITGDKLIIKSIEIRSPEITFEGNPLGDNNLNKLLANVNAFTGSSANQSAQAGTNAPSTTPAEKKATKKLEVDDFVLSGAKVRANVTGLINQQFEIPIPDIHLSNLGAGPDGITGADLTKQVLEQIKIETIKAVVEYAKGLGKNVTEAAKGAAQGAVSNALNGVMQNAAASNVINGVLQNSGPAGTNAVNQLKKGLDSFLGK